MLESLDLPELAFRDAEGRAVSAADLPQRRTALLWLEESKEPTEHILNELFEQRAAFLPFAGQVIFVLRSKAALQDATLAKTLCALPGVRVLYSDFEEQTEPLARAMYVEPGKLPLCLICEAGPKGIYAASGYNVGAGAMLLRILGM